MGGPLVGCRLKFSYLVDSLRSADAFTVGEKRRPEMRLCFAGFFVGSWLKFSIFVGCRLISVNK